MIRIHPLIEAGEALIEMAKATNPWPLVNDGKSLLESHTARLIVSIAYNVIIPYIRGEMNRYCRGGSNTSASSRTRDVPPRMSRGTDAMTNLSSTSIFKFSNNSCTTRNKRKKMSP